MTRRTSATSSVPPSPAIREELTEAGIIKAHNGDFPMAEELFLALTGLDPEDVGTALNLAFAYEEHAAAAERNEELEAAARLRQSAEQAYRRVLELDPLHADAHLNLAHFYLTQRRFGDARPHLQVYVKHGADPKRRTETEDLLRRMTADGLEEESFRRAYELVRDGSEQEGLRKIESFLVAHPDVWQAHFVRGWALRRTGSYAMAKSAFETVHEPRHRGRPGRHGRHLQRAGDLQPGAARLRGVRTQPAGGAAARPRKHQDHVQYGHSGDEARLAGGSTALLRGPSGSWIRTIRSRPSTWTSSGPYPERNDRGPAMLLRTREVLITALSVHDPGIVWVVVAAFGTLVVVLVALGSHQRRTAARHVAGTVRILRSAGRACRLTGRESRVLRTLVGGGHFRQETDLFRNRALLDGVLLRGRAALPAVLRTRHLARLALLLSIKARVEARDAATIRSSSSLGAGTRIVVTPALLGSYESEVIAGLPDEIACRIPGDDTGVELRWRRGALVTVRVEAPATAAAPVFTTVLGYGWVGGRQALLLSRAVPPAGATSASGRRATVC